MAKVRISILYPRTASSRFDFEYYTQRHMPRSIELLSSHSGYLGVVVEKGVAGAAAGSPPAYAAMCHFTFDSVESFMEAFLPHAAELQGDIPNYTNVEPVIQVNEILMSQR